jgi:hypothetical protein
LLWPEEAAAREIGVSLSALRRMRREGVGPAFVSINYRRFAYRPEAVAAWLMAHEAATLAERDRKNPRLGKFAAAGRRTVKAAHAANLAKRAKARADT